MQGRARDYGKPKTQADPSKDWGVQLRRRLISSTPETSQGMMGSEARAQRVSKLNASERPFAAGQEARVWLDEASIPIEGSGASLSSLYGLPEGYSPIRAGFTSDVAFDQAAEQQTRQYVASLFTDLSGTQRPFAAGEAAKGWLEEASSPLERPAASSDLASFYEGPSQMAISANKSFDATAEQQTRQYLKGLARDRDTPKGPFAAGNDAPGWLEAASSFRVRIHLLQGDLSSHLKH